MPELRSISCEGWATGYHWSDIMLFNIITSRSTVGKTNFLKTLQIALLDYPTKSHGMLEGLNQQLSLSFNVYFSEEEHLLLQSIFQAEGEGQTLSEYTIGGQLCFRRTFTPERVDVNLYEDCLYLTRDDSMFEISNFGTHIMNIFPQVCFFDMNEKNEGEDMFKSFLKYLQYFDFEVECEEPLEELNKVFNDDNNRMEAIASFEEVVSNYFNQIYPQTRLRLRFNLPTVDDLIKSASLCIENNDTIIQGSDMSTSQRSVLGLSSFVSKCVMQYVDTNEMVDVKDVPRAQRGMYLFIDNFGMGFDDDLTEQCMQLLINLLFMADSGVSSIFITTAKMSPRVVSLSHVDDFQFSIVNLKRIGDYIVPYTLRFGSREVAFLSSVLMLPRAIEGMQCDSVLIVEGITDYMVFNVLFKRMMGYTIDTHAFSVINVSGKGMIASAKAFFANAGCVPFVLVDADAIFSCDTLPQFVDYDQELAEVFDQFHTMMTEHASAFSTERISDKRVQFNMFNMLRELEMEMVNSNMNANDLFNLVRSKTEGIASQMTYSHASVMHHIFSDESMLTVWTQLIQLLYAQGVFVLFRGELEDYLPDSLKTNESKVSSAIEVRNLLNTLHVDDFDSIFDEYSLTEFGSMVESMRNIIEYERAKYTENIVESQKLGKMINMSDLFGKETEKRTFTMEELF
ncbi:hypothetical protein PCE1_000991 [Barthelona sp. PCE]